MNADISAAASRLCAECGMCCDGTMFHDVTLQPGDSARALAALGLRIKRRRGGESFPQPCAALRDGRCAIYADRPVRCRLFACRQLELLAAGQTTEIAAREKITAARAAIATAFAAMNRIVATNPRRALASRIANALVGAPTSAADELRTSGRVLDEILDRDFRV